MDPGPSKWGHSLSRVATQELKNWQSANFEFGNRNMVCWKRANIKATDKQRSTLRAAIPFSEVKLFHKVVRVGVFSMGWWRHRTRTNKSLPQLLSEPASCNGLNGGRGAGESYLKEDTIERFRTREGVRMDWYDPNYANGHFDIHAREASLTHEIEVSL